MKGPYSVHRIPVGAEIRDANGMNIATVYDAGLAETVCIALNTEFARLSADASLAAQQKASQELDLDLRLIVEEEFRPGPPLHDHHVKSRIIGPAEDVIDPRDRFDRLA